MATKRMFTMKIVDTDAFLDMPLTAQCLYFHLNMRADDDGFVGNPKRVARLVGCNDDDLKLLLAKGYILGFENGVIVIKHWRMHNTITRNRYHETAYMDEKSMLFLKDNNAYSMNGGKPINDKALPDGVQTAYKRRTNGVQTADSDLGLGLDIDLDIDLDLDLDKGLERDKKPTRHKHGTYSNVLLTDEDYNKLVNEFPCDYLERIDRLSEYMASTGKSYKNHLATIRNWARRDKEKPNKAVDGLKQTYDVLQEWINE